MSNPSLHAQLQTLYDIYRSSALNKDYYGAMLARYQRWNTVLEIALASTASGSGLSGLALWNYDSGKIAWGVLTAITGFLALAKPFLQLHQKIEHYSKLFTGHLDNFLQLHRIVSVVSRQEDFDKKCSAALERAFERYIQLSREDDPQTNKRIHLKSEQTVRSQLPNESLWWPNAPQRTGASLSVIETKSA